MKIAEYTEGSEKSCPTYGYVPGELCGKTVSRHGLSIFQAERANSISQNIPNTTTANLLYPKRSMCIGTSMFQWVVRSLLAVSLTLGYYVLSETKTATAQSSETVVCAVLFYSPSCSHCHVVTDQVLPTLLGQYGDRLQILSVDISQPDGQALFMSALSRFGLERGGVPFLVIGDTYLVGSVKIPERLPGLIDQHLTQGGIGWPGIPGLADAVNQGSPAVVMLKPLATPDPDVYLADNMNNSTETSFVSDLVGNTISLVILLVMLVSVGAGMFFFPVLNAPSSRLWGGAIPVLCVIGLIVAGYLAYTEVTQTEAVCGPVGDCNAVQQSEYALLFGVLPIGLLGVVGYIAILTAWVVGYYERSLLADLATAGILGMTTFGLLFSIYLTFLEPFVIGATCAWCLTSAVLMTALFWLSLAPGRLAVYSLLQKK